MNKLFKKFIEFAIGNGIVLVLGAVSTPIITRLILANEMDKFALYTMVTQLIVLVALFGADQAYIRYFNDEDEEAVGKLIRRSLKIPLIFNLFVGAVLVLFYKQIAVYISSDKDISNIFAILIVILIVVNTVSVIVSNLALTHVRMKQKAKMYSFIQCVFKVSYLIIVCLLYKVLGNSYMVLVIATVLANIIMAIMAIIVEGKDWFNFKSEKKLNTSTRELLTYGTPFVFSMAVIWIFQSVDKIAINKYCAEGELGLYTGAMQIIQLLNTVQAAFTTFWTPVAFEKFSKSPEDKDFFIKINKIVSLVMLILAVGLIATKDIIIYFVGTDYRSAVFIFPFLVFMPIMYTISETTVLGINFNKKTKYHIYIAVISAIANIIGNMILVPSLGARGAAISTGIAYIVFFVARTYFSNRLYKIDFKFKNFAIATVIVYIFATYSSFYKFNLIIFLMTIFSVVSILWLYKDVVVEGYLLVKEQLDKKKNSKV